MINWIKSNKEWLFSGLGVWTISFIIVLIPSLKQNEKFSIINLIQNNIFFLVLSCTVGMYIIIRIILRIKHNQLTLSNKFTAEKVKNCKKYYIEPTCVVDTEFNYKSSEFKIFDVLDDFFNNKYVNSNKMLILADAGMGKTSLLINYHRYNSKLFNIRRLSKFYFLPLQILVVPLGPTNLEKEIDEIVDKENTIICLDAFDEDLGANTEYQKRLNIIMNKCQQFKYIIVTCRRNFFETYDISVFLKNYDFMKMRIKSFKEKDVQKYISKRYKFDFFNLKKSKAKELINKFYTDTKFEYSPMILSNIPDLIDQKESFNTIFELYDLMLCNRIIHTCNRINQIILKNNHFKVKNSLIDFFEIIAYEMYINKTLVISEKDLKARLIVNVQEDNIPIDSLLKSVIDNFLLERTTNDCFKFTHTTILEYLFVRHFIKIDNKQRTLVRWTEIQKSFAKDAIKLNYTNIVETEKQFDLSKADLSNYLFEALPWPKNSILREVDFTGSTLEKNDLSDADLSGANLDQTILKYTNLSGAKFHKTKNLPVWILKGLDDNNRFDKNKLIDTIKKEGYDANIKLHIEKEKFIKIDLSNKKFVNIEFSKCMFEKVSFLNATIQNVSFKQSEFYFVNFEGAIIIDVFGLNEWIEGGLDSNGCFSQKRLIEAIKHYKVKNDLSFVLLDNANFSNEELKDINFSKTSLTNADFSNSKLFGIDFRKSCLIKANFSQTIFVDVKFEGANLKDAINLPEWVRSGLDIKGTFSYNNLIEKIKEKNFKDLSSANLISRDLRKANLEYADLQNADLRRADLREAILINANLKEADLRGCKLKGANLDNANLENAKLDNAIINNLTSFNNANLKNVSENIFQHN